MKKKNPDLESLLKSEDVDITKINERIEETIDQPSDEDYEDSMEDIESYIAEISKAMGLED